MTKVTCEYCKKLISCQSSLLRHQKSKTCLKIRNLEESYIVKDRFQCEYCEKFLSDSRRLNGHSLLCIERYKKLLGDKDKLLGNKDKLLVVINKLLEDKDSEIEFLKQSKDSEIESLKQNKDSEIEFLKQSKDSEIESLRHQMIELKTKCQIYEKQSEHNKEVIERIAEQPKITTTNTTNNTNLVLPMINTSREHIELMVQENYTENHLLGGQAGVAQFTKDNLLLDSNHNLGFVCTDAARKTFKRKGEDGKIIKDIRAVNLTKDIAKPIKKKACEHTTNIIERYGFESDTSARAIEKCSDVNRIEENNSCFTTRLASLTSI